MRARSAVAPPATKTGSASLAKRLMKMSNGHALLSASASHRWLHCTPSARLAEQYPDETSEFAQEGTDAHELCEYKLKLALDIKAQNPTKKLTYHCEEMEACANGYAAYILEIAEAAKLAGGAPVVLIEQRLDFSAYVPEGFGTGDCVIVTNGTLHVIDYKHGQGVLVEAADNPQMKLYALGALHLFDGIYDIDEVAMTIYQPRRENISTWTIPKTDLYQWAEETLKPKAEVAFAGEGDFACGDWCRWCAAKYECRARAEANLALAAYEFQPPALLEDADIEAILGQLDDLTSWANDIKEYAYQKALGGKHWAGYKLVEGRSVRRYTNDVAVAETVSAAGFDPFEHKLLGITAMEKTLGKPQFNQLLGALIEKPIGKPTLVPASDKREPIKTDAKTDFMEDF